jgi:hypothetical protein
MTNKNSSAPVKIFAIGDRIVFHNFPIGVKPYQGGYQGGHQTVFATVLEVNQKTLLVETKYGERYEPTKPSVSKVEDLF